MFHEGRVDGGMEGLGDAQEQVENAFCFMNDGMYAYMEWQGWTGGWEGWINKQRAALLPLTSLTLGFHKNY